MDCTPIDSKLVFAPSNTRLSRDRASSHSLLARLRLLCFRLVY